MGKTDLLNAALGSHSPRARAIERLAIDCQVDKREAARLLPAAEAKAAKLPASDLRQVRTFRALRELADQLRHLTAAAGSLYHRLNAEAYECAREVALTVVKPANTPLHAAVVHVLLHPVPAQ